MYTLYLQYDTRYTCTHYTYSILLDIHVHHVLFGLKMSDSGLPGTLLILLHLNILSHELWVCQHCLPPTLTYTRSYPCVSLRQHCNCAASTFTDSSFRLVWESLYYRMLLCVQEIYTDIYIYE